jgi:hypothetical protein
MLSMVLRREMLAGKKSWHRCRTGHGRRMRGRVSLSGLCTVSAGKPAVIVVIVLSAPFAPCVNTGVCQCLGR